MKRYGLWAAVVVALILVFVATRDPQSNSPAARADRLEHRIACPICTGESVAESNAKISRDIRADIARRIDAGESDGEILDYYARRYRKQLLNPDDGGIGLFAWGLPVAAVVLAIGGLGFTLARWRRDPEHDPAPRNRQILAVGALVVFAGLAAFSLTKAVGTREPGAAVTGNATTFQQHLDAGIRLEAAGNVESAQREYLAAARLKPKAAAPPAHLAWLLIQQIGAGNVATKYADTAAGLLDKAIASDASYADAYLYKGALLMAIRNDPKTAIAPLERYLALEPQGSKRNMAEALLARARKPTATTQTVQP